MLKMSTQSGVRLATDGGRRWTDLTGFRRDVIAAISRLEQANKPCYGSALQELLTENYEYVNESHLYNNLRTLVEEGYIEKASLDSRRNSYALTPETRAMLEAAAQQLADSCGLSVVDPDADPEI